MPKGTQMTMRGRTSVLRLCMLLDEVAQHRLGDLEVGDDAVLQRADGGDVARRAAEHALGLGADGQDALPAAASFCTATTDGSLQTMPSPFDVDQRVRRPEIDGEIVREQPEEAIKDHREKGGRYQNPERPAMKPGFRAADCKREGLG